MKELNKLINSGEGERLDFKQAVSNPYKIAKTISSFANTKGGKILVGVRDDRTILGVDPEEEKYLLNTAVDYYCDPPISVDYEEVEEEEDEKTVLIVNIPQSKNKPHFVRDDNEIRHVYVRQNDKSIPASKKMIQLMKKGRTDSQVSVAPSKLADPNKKKLISYLNNHERITLRQFMQIVNISKRRANRILTELTNEGTIRVHDHEKTDYYTL